MARKQSEGGICSIASRLHPERNEDSGYVYETWGELGVFDGVGGRPGSEFASYVAKQVITTLVEEHHDWGLENRSDLEARLLKARQVLGKIGTNDIGTTAVLARVVDHETGLKSVQVAWAGDSRAYLYSREYGLRCATLDHGATRLYAHDVGLEAWEIQHILSEARSINDIPDTLHHVWKHRNMVYSTLGVGALSDLSIERHNKLALPGDVVLLTTDGVHDNLTTSEMEAVLRDGGSSDELAAEARRVSELGVFRSKPDDMTAAMLTI